MIRQGLARIGQGILVLWGIVSLLFVIFYGVGDPTSYLVADNADEETKAAVRAKYGLDQPLYLQYARYLNRLSPIGFLPVLDQAETSHVLLAEGEGGGLAIKAPSLGRSYQSGKPVAGLILGRLEGTLILAGSALLFAGVIGIFLGAIAAFNQGKWLDQLILTSSVLGISAPSFFLGVLIAWLFAVVWQDWTGLPVSGYMFELETFGMGRTVVWSRLFLPALALGIRPLAVFIQLTRSSMIEVLDQDYIRTARSKGLPFRRVLFGHALRNALNPVLTSLTNWLASLLAGAFFIEYIFNWQGLGKLMIDAVTQQDLPVILACAMFIGLVFVVINLLTDLLYGWLDPRVRQR